jgi:hypothetical protein
VIDQGIPTACPLPQVLVAKYADHLPLYRLEQFFSRVGATTSRSTVEQRVGGCGVKLEPLRAVMKSLLLNRSVLHVDETPMPMPTPGLKWTHGSYHWGYDTTAFDPEQMVGYDFAEGCGGQHAQAFLGTGEVRWSAMTTKAIVSRCSARGRPKSAALRMRGASSTRCTRTIAARWSPTRWNRMALALGGVTPKQPLAMAA